MLTYSLDEMSGCMIGGLFVLPGLLDEGDSDRIERNDKTNTLFGSAETVLTAGPDLGTTGRVR